MEKAKVYFTKEINSASLIKMYDILDKKLEGRVAVKISTGELGGHNFLNPNLIKDLVQKLNGTIVECCTAYAGKRNTIKDHLETIEAHGFNKIAKVDLMDIDGDMAIPVKNGVHIHEDYVGKHLDNYDSVLMLSHFKGHLMAGLGGALKNMSIGVASPKGKANIHTAGKSVIVETLFDNLPEQDHFLESMAEACRAVVDHMNEKIVYINVMNNLSIDCDCDSNPEAPCMADIGILSSTDPVALDKACLDLIYASPDKGRDHMLERIETRHGERTITRASEIGLGSLDYDLINI